MLHDPLPGVDKAYSMVLQVGKHKRVSKSSEDLFDKSAMLSKDFFQRKFAPKYEKNDNKKVDKSHLICEVFKGK